MLCHHPKTGQKGFFFLSPLFPSSFCGNVNKPLFPFARHPPTERMGWAFHAARHYILMLQEKHFWPDLEFRFARFSRCTKPTSQINTSPRFSVVYHFSQLFALLMHSSQKPVSVYHATMISMHNGTIPPLFILLFAAYSPPCVHTFIICLSTLISKACRSLNQTRAVHGKHPHSGHTRTIKNKGQMGRPICWRLMFFT